MASSTITSKGQVTIPIEIRRRLGLRSGDRLEFLFGSDGEVIVRPKRVRLESLFGILRKPRQRAVSVREMDEAVRKSARKAGKRISRRKS